jgi:hypothetical protein
MTPRVPGERLYRAVARIVDEPFLKSAIEPTIADLQHELRESRGGSWRRGLIYLRGVVAIARLLNRCSAWSLNVGRIAAVVLLGLGGAASLAWAQWAEGAGPMGLVPFLGVAVIAANILRIFQLGRSYREMFVNCIGISVLMSVGLWRDYGRLTEVPLWVAGRAVLTFVLCLGLASAMVAAVAWKPRSGTSNFHRGMLALATGLCVFAVANLGIRVLGLMSLTTALATVSRSAFMAFLFALVASVSLLPALVLARRILSSRWALALVAAILSPLLITILDGFGSGWSWRLVSMLFSGDDVARAMAIFAPFILASAAVGWMMGSRESSVRQVEIGEPLTSSRG